MARLGGGGGGRTGGGRGRGSSSSSRSWCGGGGEWRGRGSSGGGDRGGGGRRGKARVDGLVGHGCDRAGPDDREVVVVVVVVVAAAAGRRRRKRRGQGWRAEGPQLSGSVPAIQSESVYFFRCPLMLEYSPQRTEILAKRGSIGVMTKPRRYLRRLVDVGRGRVFAPPLL